MHGTWQAAGRTAEAMDATEATNTKTIDATEAIATPLTCQKAGSGLIYPDPGIA